MPPDGKKMIFDRIQITENYFGDLCSELSSITKKKARLRDKYDDLARIFNGYADTVRFNETLFNGLMNYSKSCTLMADVKDTEVQRLQLKTLQDVASYENVCRNAREALKHSLLQRGKEHLKQRNQQRNPDQNDSEESKSNQDFEMNLMKFERQRIDDVRRILMDFTLIQLKECVKSMDILTTMYNDVASIDSRKDLEEFEQKFLNKDGNRLKASSRSQSLSALTNNAQPLKRANLSNSTMSLSSPNRDDDSIIKNGKSDLSDNDSDEDDTSKTSENSSESAEELSDGSSKNKLSSENRSSYYEDEDDKAVQVRPIREAAKKNANRNVVPAKRSVPVPQVRFSKQVKHIKK